MRLRLTKDVDLGGGDKNQFPNMVGDRKFAMTFVPGQWLLETRLSSHQICPLKMAYLAPGPVCLLQVS